MSKKTFSVTIVNAHADARTFVIGRGLNDAEVGQLIEGAFDAQNDVADAASLTATGKPFSVNKFNEDFREAPLLVSKIKFKSNSALQTEEVITYKRDSAYQGLGDQPIALSDYTDENTQRDGIVTMNRTLQFDHKSKLEVPVVGASSLTITIEIVNSFDRSDQAAAYFRS